MKRKLPNAVTFVAESVTVYNENHDSLGVIFVDDDDGCVLFESSGITLTADQLVSISAEMYAKEKAE
jgi:hypothetical protein